MMSARLCFGMRPDSSSTVLQQLLSFLDVVGLSLTFCSADSVVLCLSCAALPLRLPVCPLTAPPSLPQGPNGLQQATWGEALAAIAGAAQGLGANEFKAIAGKLADAESMIALKVRRSSAARCLFVAAC